MPLCSKPYMSIKTCCIAVLSLLSGLLPARAIVPDTVYVQRPEQFGLMYKELPVRTTDGYDLATWFFPAQEVLTDEEWEVTQGVRPYKTIDDTPRPTIIICNGDAGNMSYFQLPLAYAWTSMGFNVATFDWRGFGASSPFPMDANCLCYTEMLTDYAAVVDAVTALPEVRCGAVAVMGWSTGAYLSMITAWRNHKVNAFIGRSLATCFDDVIPLVMEVRGKTANQLLVPEDFPAGEMPVYIAPTFTKPIFLINGSNDRRTPVWMSEKVLALLPLSTPRRLMVVEGAGHGGKEDPMILEFERFVSQVADFLKEQLGVEDNARGR